MRERSRNRPRPGRERQALTVSVLEGASSPVVTKTLNALVSIFNYASTNYGPLAERDCGLAIFPRGGLGGGTALGQTLASEDDPLTIVHEMLHWWTNPGTPAWFREGVHSYIALKLLAESTSMDAATFEAFLRGSSRSGGGSSSARAGSLRSRIPRTPTSGTRAAETFMPMPLYLRSNWTKISGPGIRFPPWNAFLPKSAGLDPGGRSTRPAEDGRSYRADQGYHGIRGWAFF